MFYAARDVPSRVEIRRAGVDLVSASTDSLSGLWISTDGGLYVIGECRAEISEWPMTLVRSGTLDAIDDQYWNGVSFWRQFET